METTEPRYIKKNEYENTSRKVETMLRAFINEHNVEHTMEQSESGWVYVLHLNPSRQEDVRIRIWNYASERPTRVYSLPMRIPTRSRYLTAFNMVCLPINPHNGKLVLLSFAENLDEDIIENFERTLVAIASIIKMNRQQTA